MDKNELLQHDESFRYSMLDRMRTDCEYYLGYGNRHPKYLWGGNEVDHISYMKALWQSFPEDGKPEWLPYEKIQEYEEKMCPKAVLIELIGKGDLDRFALSSDEFMEKYGSKMTVVAYSEDGWRACSVEPDTRFWCSETVIGNDLWNQFFTDMEYGLSEGVLMDGFRGVVRDDMMASLKQYLPEGLVADKKTALDNRIQVAQKTAETSVKPHAPVNEHDR